MVLRLKDKTAVIEDIHSWHNVKSYKILTWGDAGVFRYNIALEDGSVVERTGLLGDEIPDVEDLSPLEKAKIAEDQIKAGVPIEVLRELTLIEE